MWPNPEKTGQDTVDFVTFTEEIIDGELHFLCSNNCHRLGLLFPFGFFNGDSTLPNADDTDYVVFTSSSGFPFLTNKEYQLRVCIYRFSVFVVASNNFCMRKFSLTSRIFIFIHKFFDTQPCLIVREGWIIRGEQRFFLKLLNKGNQNEIKLWNFGNFAWGLHKKYASPHIYFSSNSKKFGLPYYLFYLT